MVNVIDMLFYKETWAPASLPYIEGVFGLITFHTFRVCQRLNFYKSSPEDVESYYFEGVLKWLFLILCQMLYLGCISGMHIIGRSSVGIGIWRIGDYVILIMYL